MIQLPIFQWTNTRQWRLIELIELIELIKLLELIELIELIEDNRNDTITYGLNSFYVYDSEKK